MPIPQRAEILENAYAALSENYKGLEVDIYEVCKEKRQNEPVMVGDFMRWLHVFHCMCLLISRTWLDSLLLVVRRLYRRSGPNRRTYHVPAEFNKTIGT